MHKPVKPGILVVNKEPIFYNLSATNWNSV